ncbi:MAG: outer membrane beta-barrel protein [Saprospiraceae bacterium]
MSQEKFNLGIGGKITVLDFSLNQGEVSVSPMYGLTFHTDVNIRSKIMLKSGFELNNVAVNFHHNVSASTSQIAIPILLSYQVYKKNSWSIFVEGGPYLNHSIGNINSENGDYYYLGYSYKLQSSNVNQDKFYLNYGLRLGISVKKQLEHKTSLNFAIHYVKSLRNTNSLYYEYRLPHEENGVTSHTFTRNTFDFIQNSIQCTIYLGFGFKKLNT